MKKTILSRVIALILCATLIISVLPSTRTFAKSTEGNTIYITGGIKDWGYTDIEYNYAKLLQYALYFYDANMCGVGVDSASLHDWRGDCHTYDTGTYTRKDGVTVNVNATGGFHDAGDHVKFGLPEAYAAIVLETSYYSDKGAYELTTQTGHLKTLTDWFADYFKRCMVLDASGNVEAFVCQVGDGDADHSVWCSPEVQEKGNRPIQYATESSPSTDIVSLSAASLAMHYINFGDEESLTAAKKLFVFAKNNTKATDTKAGWFYASSGWADDYCLAAVLLNKATGDEAYLTEYNTYKDQDKAKNFYWALSWDNVAPLIPYFRGDAGNVENAARVGYSNVSYGFWTLDNWGSARYNTAIQYMGLLYDKMTGNTTFQNDAENQMKFILGNNSEKQCFVIGYNDASSMYPHHRAATGYGFDDVSKRTVTPKHVLLGALVGGMKKDGSYVDAADDYQTNEVTLDYNATLVAAAAALYNIHKSETDQVIDPNYYPVEEIDHGKTDPEYTEPEAKGLTYNGTEQELITDGVVTGGTMKYALGSDTGAQPALTEFTTKLPKAENAGDYNVWYLIEETSEHNGIGPVKIAAKIKKKDIRMSLKNGDQYLWGTRVDASKRLTVTGLEEKDKTTETNKINALLTVPKGITYQMDYDEYYTRNNYADMYQFNVDADKLRNYNAQSVNYYLTVDGNTSAIFAITHYDISGNYSTIGRAVKISVDKTEFKYNGEEHGPTVIVKAPYDSYNADTKKYITDYYNVELGVYGDSTAVNVGDYAMYVIPSYDDSFSGRYDLNWSIVESPLPKVVTPPAAKKLTYNKKSQKLITAGVAENGKMYYAISNSSETAPDISVFSEAIPEKTKAGDYYVWYMAASEDGPLHTDPVCVNAKIDKAMQTVTADDLTLKPGENAKINAKTSGDGYFTYEILSGEAVTVDETGNVKAVKLGTSVITVVASETDNYYAGSKDIKVTVANVKIFTVTFNANGHGKAPATQKVESGKKAKKPANPAASGYKFEGWYTTKACKKGTEYNWSTPITKNITLYAKWTQNVKTVDMLRLYNPNSGEHFYTASAAEKDTLVKAGWQYEGLAWKAPEKSNTPVYRVYNANAGDHHYTISKVEKENLVKAGWKDEGIGWYSDDAKTVPIYRVYNPNAKAGSHHFTLSKNEVNDLVKIGWKDEGIAWFGR